MATSPPLRPATHRLHFRGNLGAQLVGLRLPTVVHLAAMALRPEEDDLEEPVLEEVAEAAGVDADVRLQVVVVRRADLVAERALAVGRREVLVDESHPQATTRGKAGGAANTQAISA